MRRAIVYSLLILFSILCLVPIIWLVASAFKANADFHTYAFIPPVDRLTSANFISLFKQMPFLRFMMNSFFVAGVTVIVQLFFSSLGGFALAKYRFAGKKVIMGVMLATMMIPGPVLLAPRLRRPGGVRWRPCRLPSGRLGIGPGPHAAQPVERRGAFDPLPWASMSALGMK